MHQHLIQAFNLLLQSEQRDGPKIVGPVPTICRERQSCMLKQIIMLAELAGAANRQSMYMQLFAMVGFILFFTNLEMHLL